MRILLALACLVVPTIAAAQPGPSTSDPPPPDPTTPAPPPPVPATPAPPPQAPPPGPGAPMAGAPMPGAPMYGAPNPWAFHQGITFEANLGVGYTHESVSAGGLSATNDSDAALAGADLGLGGWINPQLAMGVRISGVQVKNTMNGMTSPSTGNIVHAFVGPNVQYWPTPNIWLGGGAGFSTLQWLNSGNSCTGDQCGSNGFGFNLRAGYTFGAGGPHTFNISLESNTGFYSQNDGATGTSVSATITGFAILAGYQYL